MSKTTGRVEAQPVSTDTAEGGVTIPCAPMLEPLPSDVLLGRAAKVFHHSGNKRYRTIIAMNIPLYKRAGTKLDKMILIKQVTEQVMDHGRVRFLRQEGKTRYWTQVVFRVAQDKVSHALRDGISKPLFHSKSSSTAAGKNKTTTSVAAAPRRVVVAVTQKKKIDPLALLAATSQMKMPLPDSAVYHSSLQQPISRTGTYHHADAVAAANQQQQWYEGQQQMKNPLQNTNMDTTASQSASNKTGAKQQTGHYSLYEAL
eukprot:CAMPEP_0119027846 /NCGR_PEP_ID=MMETSP1176-20130426/37856_1 /TAXON_ID=265551 /ORGANISM="Synedropsis recta cf, Strain CCMP1620" /LENGTH=257 /DNA_ID=CAMNT_0006983855 /DNA_START=160 /DNA_END=933 /DNA_ORIENTATION=-